MSKHLLKMSWIEHLTTETRSVRAAEELLLSSKLDHEYLPTHGCPKLRQVRGIYN